jgi:hypothetical protein
VKLLAQTRIHPDDSRPVFLGGGRRRKPSRVTSNFVKPGVTGVFTAKSSDLALASMPGFSRCRSP